MKVTVKSKGMNNDDWAVHEVEVSSKENAQAEIDAMFAVKRDKNGKQTNADMIQVEIVE